MDRLDREAEPEFTQPVRQIVLMLLVLLLVGAGAYIAYPRVAPVFLANPYLNGFIGFVFVIGVFACFWQVFQLISSVSWIEGFAQDRPGHQFTRAPRLLASLATLLRKRGARMEIGSSSSRSILDSVATRIDEARDITRYIVNLLIFLGLLGTFYGLATTVPAVVDTIRSLAPSDSEGGIEVFSRLMTGLEAQLGGMGVAFASSLLGLAGSLVVGLLELFAGHGQNRFYRELEDWLSTITRVGFATGDTDGDILSDASATSAVLDHMAEQMDGLKTLYESSDASRAAVDDRLAHLAASIETLAAGAQGSSSEALDKIAAGQERLLMAIEAQGGRGAVTEGGEPDAEARMRLRSMDVQLLRILEELSSGRQEMLADLRTDIHQLTRAVEALGRGGPDR
ncbi:MAG: biopolymer transporter ExbB [Alphaproteobacteria bacterium]|nr:biopolymer transporter ExbB [Alphaproteobacteria bacterium]